MMMICWSVRLYVQNYKTFFVQFSLVSSSWSTEIFRFSHLSINNNNSNGSNWTCTTTKKLISSGYSGYSIVAVSEWVFQSLFFVLHSALFLSRYCVRAVEFIWLSENCSIRTFFLQISSSWHFAREWCRRCRSVRVGKWTLNWYFSSPSAFSIVVPWTLNSSSMSPSSRDDFLMIEN